MNSDQEEVIAILREDNVRLQTQLEQVERQRTHEYYETSPSMYNMVRKFHETYGLVVNDEPLDLYTPDDRDELVALLQLRMNLVKEEFEEFCAAMHIGDLEDIADAIMDLHYVLSGTCVSFGIPEDACFAEVQRSNMSKLGEDGKPIVREDGKILKGPNFSPPDLKKVIYGES